MSKMFPTKHNAMLLITIQQKTTIAKMLLNIEHEKSHSTNDPVSGAAGNLRFRLPFFVSTCPVIRETKESKKHEISARRHLMGKSNLLSMKKKSSTLFSFSKNILYLNTSTQRVAPQHDT